MKFELGQIVITRGIKAYMDENNIPQPELHGFITRHVTGDWGIVNEEDKEMNELAVRDGDRILSAYMWNDTKIWIITESNRSVTTILLPDEY